jgi:hypothetical protein
MNLIDTGSSSDHSQLAAETPGLAGKPGNQSAEHQRPVPRSVKEKRYKELLKQTQAQRKVGLMQFSLGVVQMLRSMDAEARRQHNRDIATFYQYYDCNEYGEFNEAGEWIADAQNQEEFSYSMPMTPAHVDSAKTLLLRTQLEYEYEAKNKFSSIDSELARMCEELAEEDMQRIFTDELRGDELLYLLLAGKSYRHHYWASDPLGINAVEVPDYSMETVDLPEMKVCGNPECGMPLASDAVICSKCMSETIITTGGGSVTKTQMQMKSVTLGQNQMYVPNPLAVQHDLSKTNITKSFVIERDTLPRSEAEFLYCQVLKNNRDGISEEMKMVWELERARLRTGQDHNQRDAAVVRSMFANDADLVERERAWVEPWRYANVLIWEEHWYYTKQDGLFWCEDQNDLPPNAKHVEPGTFIGDIYPNGYFICAVDDTVVEINGSSVSDRWNKLVFGKRPANADGAGLQRLRPLADMANDATNLEFKILMDDADPKTFLNRKYINHLSKVGEYQLVDNIAEGTSKDNVAWRLEGASAHPALGAMAEKIHQYSQYLTGTYSSIGPGAPDVKALGTATGVVKMAEEASGRFLEAIIQVRQADIDSRYKCLKNRQTNSIEPQIQELKQRFGTEVTKRFMSANFRDAVGIKAKAGTDQPQSRAIRIAEIESFGQFVGQLGDNPNGMSLITEVAEAMRLPLTVGTGLADKEEAQRRLGILRETCQKFDEKILQPVEVFNTAGPLVAELLGKCESEPIDIETMMEQRAQAAAAPPMPVNPATGEAGQPAPPPEAPEPEVPSIVMMQGHAVFMDAYRDWILTEGARCNNQVMKMAVQMLWKLHFEREKAKQIELAKRTVKIQMSSMPPAPPEPPPEQPHPMQKISESINYKDAPDDVRRQMEKAAGMEPSQSGGTQDEEGSGDDETAGKILDHTLTEHAKDEDLKREALKMEYQHELSKEAEHAKPTVKGK